MMPNDLRPRVSAKGALSVYFPGRALPVTSYKREWEAILGSVDAMKSFLNDHAGELGVREANL
jgi:hypothetical protein